jgi:pimeloyl-ACP methyl ester carboxylesterase
MQLALMKTNPMGTYVLVHGGNMSTDTWDKLSKSNAYAPGGHLGGRVWDSIIPALRAHNYHVFAPTLKDEHSSHLIEHIEQICTLITDNGLTNILLVGHSYGGMIITGVAAEMPERISRLVYIDAALPNPGQSLFDIIASGGSDPLSFAGLEPAAPYVEKLQFDAGNLESLPKTYIPCTESEFASVTNVARQKIAAEGKGWTYIELPTSHVPMASMPEQLSQLLLEAASFV